MTSSPQQCGESLSRESVPLGLLVLDRQAAPFVGAGAVLRLLRGRKQRLQGADLHRLDQVMIESRIARPSQMLALPPAGDGNEQRTSPRSVRANASCDLVPVHLRHADV